MTSITIPLLDGTPWKVDALVIGDLALHPSRKKPGHWSVTHVPTMMHVNKAIPRGIDQTDDKALARWMRLVQEDLKKDWAALRKITAEEVRENPKKSHALRARIRKHLMETKA
jgi:hypothetical protein